MKDWDIHDACFRYDGAMCRNGLLRQLVRLLSGCYLVLAYMTYSGEHSK